MQLFLSQFNIHAYNKTGGWKCTDIVIVIELDAIMICLATALLALIVHVMNLRFASLLCKVGVIAIEWTYALPFFYFVCLNP